MVQPFEALMNEHTDFTLSTFTKATAKSSMLKLRSEIDEVIKAIEMQEPGLAEEYADCIMCILDSAARMGIGAREIRRAFFLKVEKNKSRTWKENGDGTYSHVKNI